MLANHPTLSLHIPEPSGRPGDEPDFSHLKIPEAGALSRPDPTAAAEETRPHAYGLVRVLDDAGAAVGPWAPQVEPERLKTGLRAMLLTREFDDRMFKAQRQGKTTIYVKSLGEEAIACAQALALDPRDMCFPSYRQQGLLITRGYPMVDMINQIFGNAADPLKGHHQPIFYSSRDYGFFSISGNLATQFSQAVGWGMASAYKGDDRIASAYIGDGATAEGDFHQALLMAAVYRAPVILNIVNNQWAISSFQGIANPKGATFAARGIGYALPTLRVDGNDFLAVYAATMWAAERARANLGATVIELFTYRAEGHSTSDDPSKYRPQSEPRCWPLGDPIDRLRRHLDLIGALAADEFEAMVAEAREAVRIAAKQAEAIGHYREGERPSVALMLEDVYAEPPWHLRRQRQEMGV